MRSPVKPGTHVSQLTGYWQRLRAKMGLQDVRLHDLRHSYASRALALGESLPTIGKLLGHTSMDHVTQIYPESLD